MELPIRSNSGVASPFHSIFLFVCSSSFLDTSLQCNIFLHMKNKNKNWWKNFINLPILIIFFSSRVDRFFQPFFPSPLGSLARAIYVTPDIKTRMKFTSITTRTSKLFSLSLSPSLSLLSCLLFRCTCTTTERSTNCAVCTSVISSFLLIQRPRH